jgi:hypothetical protein
VAPTVRRVAGFLIMNAVSLLSSRLAQAGLLLLSVSLPVMAQSTTPAPAAAAASQPKPASPETEPRRSLGVVTINGTRLTALPTQIPTTIEGVTVTTTSSKYTSSK